MTWACITITIKLLLLLSHAIACQNILFAKFAKKMLFTFICHCMTLLSWILHWRVSNFLLYFYLYSLHDCNKYTLCPNKNILNIFNCNFKKDYQILIIFGMNIPETTGQQTTIYFLISPNVCFCTTWVNQNQRNITFLSNAVWLLTQHNT